MRADIGAFCDGFCLGLDGGGESLGNLLLALGEQGLEIRAQREGCDI